MPKQTPCGTHNYIQTYNLFKRQNTLGKISMCCNENALVCTLVVFILLMIILYKSGSLVAWCVWLTGGFTTYNSPVLMFWAVYCRISVNPCTTDRLYHLHGTAPSSFNVIVKIVPHPWHDTVIIQRYIQDCTTSMALHWHAMLESRSYHIPGTALTFNVRFMADSLPVVCSAANVQRCLFRTVIIKIHCWLFLTNPPCLSWVIGQCDSLLSDPSSPQRVVCFPSARALQSLFLESLRG